MQSIKCCELCKKGKHEQTIFLWAYKVYSSLSAFAHAPGHIKKATFPTALCLLEMHLFFFGPTPAHILTTPQCIYPARTAQERIRCFGLKMGSEVIVPEPNDWKTEFPQLRLAQPIHIAMPCCGIDGAGWSLRAMGVPFTPNNVYDLETRYKEYWQGMVEEGSPLHFGKHDGDIVQVELSDLERPVHVLCSGPPCPPWAGNGNKKGVEDFRAKAFLAIVNIVASLAKCGELQAAVLENVQGILHRQGGEESFMSKLLRILQEEVREFLWQVDTLKAVDYKLAQDRTRVFLRGIRSKLCPSGAVPPPLPPFGHRVLTDFLASMPCVDRNKLTKCMAQNLKDSQEQLRKLLQEGRLEETDVVCFALDRADGKTYKRHISVNRTPTLTTSNSYLFVSDMKMGLPDQQRTHFRFLHPQERFVLQGFNVEVAQKFASSQALQVKAAGNAYPVPLIGAAMAPLLAALGELPQAGEKELEFPTRFHERLADAMYGAGKKSKPKKAGHEVVKRPAARQASHKPASKKLDNTHPEPAKTHDKEPANQHDSGGAQPLGEEPAVPSTRKRPASTASTASMGRPCQKPRLPHAWRLRGFLSSSSSESG